jgi:CheY-like chemotaxis protein
MALRGPVVVIEDDTNDADVIAAAIAELRIPNELRHFGSAPDALEYLMTTREKPLVILSDIRMPGMDGLALLRHIWNTDFLRQKSIPFVFFTGLATRQLVTEAYEMGVQGFFKKADNYVELRDQMYAILAYWARSLHPNVEV